MNQTDNRIAQLEDEVRNLRAQLEKFQKNGAAHLGTTAEIRKETGLRQALFIKILQIFHLEKDIPTAMNIALAEIGKFTGMSRMQIWEDNPDGVHYGVSYEWCNEGVEPAMHYLKNVRLDYGKPWFDMLARDRMICTSDISTLHPAMIEILQPQGVKAITVLPLAEYGKFFGYISFTVLEDRVWEKEDVELLQNIAQIVSTTSKRYQAETITKQSQQVMRTVLDNIKSNIFVIDCETMKILFSNKSFDQEIGENAEGQICWQSFKAGRNTECEGCPKQKLLDENGRPNDVVYFWEDYNPLTKRWYTIETKALEWIDGRPAIMEFATDTSDRKLAELELFRAKEKAEEADNLKSAFLANMSHEIRTPINGIIGFMRFLNSEDLSAARRKEFINIINNSSTQLAKLIDDIIDVAKIEAKQMNINPSPVRINDMMEELRLFFETSIQVDKKQHISLILDDAEFLEDSLTYADATRLRQVIINLMNNAIKFTEKGFIRFGYRQSAPDMLEFVVEDSGIGIKLEKQEIIFERFRQAHITHDRLYGGTGLGLHISRTLVQMMGGDMWVESSEGEGSSFYFTISYLPVTLENEELYRQQFDENDHMEKFSLNRMALVVMSGKMKYGYIEKFLAISGFAASQVPNISQAIDHILRKANHVDVVIVDATQANDNEIKQIKSICANLPVIFIGGKRNIHSKQLEEPINQKELAKILEKC